MPLLSAFRRYLGMIPAAPGLSEERTAGGLLLSIYEGSVYSMTIGLIAGQFLAGFALEMGAGRRGVAITLSLPALAGVVQVMVGPYLAARFPRISVLAVGAGLHRIGWGLSGLLVTLLPRPYWFTAYATALFLACAAQAASVPAWWSLMADLVPDDLRGRYFGLRNSALAVVGMLTVLVAGWLLDRIGGLRGFLVLHGAAAGAGVLNTYLMARHPEPRRKRQEPVAALAPLKDRAFRLIALFLGLWTLAVTIAAPYYSITMLRELKLPFAQVSWLMVTAALAASASLFAWGPLCDRMGEGRIISWLAPPLATVPLGWLFAKQLGLPLLFGLHAVQGATMAGIGLALGNLNLAMAGDGPERSAYLALFSATIGLAGGLGPLLGSWIGAARSAFLLAGAASWALWAVWWLWYRPHQMVQRARRSD